MNPDVYTVLQASREGEGSGTNFRAISRLRDGATWAEADTEINRAWAARVRRFDARNPGAHLIYHSVPLQKGQTDSLRPQVLALMVAAGFILLIACANLAGLTLVRMSRRTPEVATRLALGASRWQIQKQFWMENLLLAFVGGVLGVGVGLLALHGLLLLLPEHFLPVSGVSLDGTVLGFALVVSLLTSVLFGMLPARAAHETDLRSSMANRVIAGVHNLHFRQALIGGEVALTVVLLAATGLLIRTLIHLQTLPAGFNPNGVLAAKASLDDARFHDPAAFGKLLNESTAAMRQLLSAVGIFGLVANMVVQRTREIGIRMALGSTIAGAMVQIGRSGAIASAIGLPLGLVLCAGALPLMRSVLYGVGVYDASSLAVVVGLLAAVILFATTLPTLKIARIDPANTLREE